MNKTVAGLALMAASALVVTACGDEPPYQNISIEQSSATHLRPTGEETAAGIVAINDLAGELFLPLARKAGEGGQGNLVFSPPALAAALGRVHAGAQGPSEEQLAALLGPVKGAGLDRAINGAVEPLRDASGPERTADGTDVTVQLEVGAEVFGQSGLDWEDTYLDALKESYDAEIVNLDFEKAPDRGVGELNSRMADSSAGMVEDLVPEGALSADTRLVIAAATGLDGPWFTALEPQGTAPFTRPDGSDTDVAMVGAELTSHYILADDWQSVTLPLAGQDLAVTFILPDAGRLGVVQDDLATVLTEATTDGPKVNVTVSFPSFSVTSDHDVPAAVARLGVEAPFAKAGTDLEPMTADEPLRVDGAYHRATLTVDADGVRSKEAGEQAASSGEPTTTGLRIDRTFLFVVHQVGSGTPVFVGRVSDPTA